MLDRFDNSFNNFNVQWPLMQYPLHVSSMTGVLAMENYEIPGEVYAWTAVLILPINSALNPFLYTLSAIIASKVHYMVIL